MPPCANRTRPTSNCLSCRPALPLRNCCAGMTQMTQKPAPFGVGFFYGFSGNAAGSRPETHPHSPYIPGMYTKTPSQRVPAVHTSARTPSWPLYIPGMYTKSASQRVPAVHTSAGTLLLPLYIPGMYTKTAFQCVPAVHTSAGTLLLPLYIPGMYTKTPSQRLPAVHTSARTPSWPLYIPGMYTKTASYAIPAVHTSAGTASEAAASRLQPAAHTRYVHTQKNERPRASVGSYLL